MVRRRRQRLSPCKEAMHVRRVKPSFLIAGSATFGACKVFVLGLFVYCSIGQRTGTLAKPCASFPNTWTTILCKSCQSERNSRIVMNSHAARNQLHLCNVRCDHHPYHACRKPAREREREHVARTKVPCTNANNSSKGTLFLSLQATSRINVEYTRLHVTYHANKRRSFDYPPLCTQAARS